MKLRDLIDGVSPVAVTGDCDIEGLSTDSRRVRKGDLFFAVRGGRFDGNRFVGEAVERGAAAVVSELPLSPGVPAVQVRDVHAAMAHAADRFYGHPSGRMRITGITGTNGKTTTSYILHSILTVDGSQAGLIGTIRNITGSREERAAFTTPEAVDFQRILAGMLGEGVTRTVAEVSSHALALRRVDCTDFSVAVFTNLTRDHLDFHGDMEAYYRAKKRLFSELATSAAVINIDDPYGMRLYGELREERGGDFPIVTCGIGNEGAALRALEIREGFDGLDFSLVHGTGVFRVASPLVGITNVYNILAAVGAALASGIGWDGIITGVRRCRGVDGRMEPVKAGQDFLAVVDYAHTPDALRKAIETLRRLTRGRIITVFGCGGDRDRGKRPEMGRIASNLSDVAVVTSDNPRTEDPGRILKDITAAMDGGYYIVEPDRRRAIEAAVSAAGPGDVVLVAGKGHEDYQDVGGVRHPFSDREVLRESIGKALSGAL